MLSSRSHFYFPDGPIGSSIISEDRIQDEIQNLRKEKKNHTSKLRELELLIPVTLKTRNKKLTKKDILLHVLHYIQHLQRSISVVKALLKLHTSEDRDEPGGLGWDPSKGPAKRRHSTPSSSPSSQKSHLRGTYQTPRKKFTRLAEHPTCLQKPRRSLILDLPESLLTLRRQEKGSRGASIPPRCPQTLSQDDGGEVAQLMLLDMAGNTITWDVTSECYLAGIQDGKPDVDIEVQKKMERYCFLNKIQPCLRQDVCLCESSKDTDKEAPGADPWLPVWTSKDSPNGIPLALEPSQINTWYVTGHSSEILELSPSFIGSPSKILPDHILEDKTYFLTEGLFEEVFLRPQSPPVICELEASQEKAISSEAPTSPPDTRGLCQSLVSLDHCYLSLSEASQVQPSSSSEFSDEGSLWEQDEDELASPESYSDEDRDYLWTPTQRATALPVAGRKSKKSQGPPKPKDGKKAPFLGQAKKKCVNGFIMFCRMNRKQYIRTCPGTASTVATKDLAKLWRLMTPQERRPYCTKARRFSRQHNRIVKEGPSSDEDWEVPKPFHQLLAEKGPYLLSTSQASERGLPLPGAPQFV